MNARRIATLLAAGFLGTLLSLTPAQAAVSVGQPDATVAAAAGEAHTTLETNGAKAAVNKRWWPTGNGEYTVEYWGTVYDTKDDSARARMFRHTDGSPLIVAQAVGAGKWEPFHQTRDHVKRLTLQVCTYNESDGRSVACSGEW